MMLHPPGWLAADAGFEPALPDPESGVLPLDESATACYENYNRRPISFELFALSVEVQW